MPPNIDFYLLLDNSPSMSLPATAAGITSMRNLTSNQDGGNGCAFACHQASTTTATPRAICALSDPAGALTPAGATKGKPNGQAVVH